MIRCKRLMVVAASGFLSVTLIAAGTGTLRIQVRDSEGAVLGGAYVVIRPDDAGRPQPSRATATTTRADSQGRLTNEVEPGFFDVCVMSDAFVPACQKVRIAAGQVKDITMRMKVDPSVIREIGDTFPTGPGGR